jgi:hypothetical protein
MFGYAGFSQATFAALAPVAYTAAITEASTFADVLTGGFAFSTAITEDLTVADVLAALRTQNANITESIDSIADVKTALSIFNFSVSESLTVANSAAASNVFYGNVAENLTLNDSNTTILVYNVSANEPISLEALPLGAVWIKIDNSQNTSWVLVDNSQ